MLVQAMPIYKLVSIPNSSGPCAGCFGTKGSAPAINYSLNGPHMKYAIKGAVPAGSLVSVTLAGYTPPFSISVGQGETKSATAKNISSGDAVVTYGYFGSTPGTGPVIGAFVIVRVP
jgi:hypothetical protein